jgi:hypothetical protein
MLGAMIGRLEAAWAHGAEYMSACLDMRIASAARSASESDDMMQPAAWGALSRCAGGEPHACIDGQNFQTPQPPRLAFRVDILDQPPPCRPRSSSA